MNEQVFTITTSAWSASGTTLMPAWCRWPTMISESTRFFAQPSETRLTLAMEKQKRRSGRPPRVRGSGRTPYFFFAALARSFLRFR